jgi:hypothetical protein
LNTARCLGAPSILIAALALLPGCYRAAMAPERVGPITSWAVTSTESPDLTIWTAKGNFSLHADRDRIIGPEVNLTWVKGGEHPILRGIAGRFVLDLRYEDGRLRGATNNGIVNLGYEEEDRGVRVSGMFNGERVNMLLNPQVVEGWVGNCSYKLVNREDMYVGSRTCGRRVLNTRLTLTEQLGGDRANVNFAVALPLLLAL